MKVVWNVPNVLTALRVLAAPLLAYFLMRGHYDYALYTFVLAAFTDALDGFIARHFNQYTEFGAALDPLADKLITLTCRAMKPSKASVKAASTKVYSA